MYKIFIAIIVLTVIATKWVDYKISSDLRPNYLYMGSLDFKNHAINNSFKTQSKIIFLGSSAVAGSNIPPNTTVSDYFNKHFKGTLKSYNLATLQGSLLDSLIYFEKSLSFHPKFAILGINPGSFPLLPSGPLVWANMDIVSSHFSSDFFKKINDDKNTKRDLSNVIKSHLPSTIPSQLVINYKTAIYNLKKVFLGNTYEKYIFGHRGQSLTEVFNENNELLHFLKNLKSYFESKGVNLIIYMEPIYKPNITYGEKDFNHYRNTLNDLLSSQEILYKDYTDLFPPIRENFIDFIHLTPKAYEKLAIQLINDFGGLLQ